MPNEGEASPSVLSPPGLGVPPEPGDGSWCGILLLGEVPTRNFLRNPDRLAFASGPNYVSNRPRGHLHARDTESPWWATLICGIHSSEGSRQGEGDSISPGIWRLLALERGGGPLGARRRGAASGGRVRGAAGLAGTIAGSWHWLRLGPAAQGDDGSAGGLRPRGCAGRSLVSPGPYPRGHLDSGGGRAPRARGPPAAEAIAASGTPSGRSRAPPGVLLRRAHLSAEPRRRGGGASHGLPADPGDARRGQGVGGGRLRL